MYLLDTCVISDFVKGELNTLSKIKSLSPKLFSISTITLMEIEYGLKQIAKKRVHIDPILNKFFEVVEIIPFCTETVYVCAKIRYNLSQNNIAVSPYDLLTASIALFHQKILVTSNVSEFTRIEGLQVENWRNV